MNSKNHQNYSEIRSAVLLNTFLIEKKRYRVFYNNGLLIWEKEKSKNSEYRKPWIEMNIYNKSRVDAELNLHDLQADDCKTSLTRTVKKNYVAITDLFSFVSR